MGGKTPRTAPEVVTTYDLSVDPFSCFPSGEETYSASHRWGAVSRLEQAVGTPAFWQSLNSSLERTSVRTFRLGRLVSRARCGWLSPQSTAPVYHRLRPSGSHSFPTGSHSGLGPNTTSHRWSVAPLPGTAGELLDPTRKHLAGGGIEPPVNSLLSQRATRHLALVEFALAL